MGGGDVPVGQFDIHDYDLITDDDRKKIKESVGDSWDISHFTTGSHNVTNPFVFINTTGKIKGINPDITVRHRLAKWRNRRNPNGSPI